MEDIADEMFGYLGPQHCNETGLPKSENVSPLKHRHLSIFGDSIDRDMGTSPKLATAESAASVFTMAMDETFEDVVPGGGEQGS